MKNGLAYRLEWTTAINNLQVTVKIWDTNVQIEDSDTVEVRELVPAGTPFVVRSLQGKKLSPIKGKQAEIKFISTPNYDSTTFSEGPDNRFYVEATVFDAIALEKTLFLGYLIHDDSSQLFQPNPVIVTLIASDHLALLSEVDFSEDNESNPSGHYRISEILALCLKKTKLNLPVNVINNLTHGTGEYTAEVDFASNAINLPAETEFFYRNQLIRVSGTASNDGIYHVRGDIDFFNINLVTVQETFVTESNVTATFTDVTSEYFHWFNSIFLNVGTFEEKIGESKRAVDVLSYILGEDSFLTQYLGEWWIIRYDEYDGNPMYLAQYDSDGVYIGNVAGTDYIRSIGHGEDHVFALADCILQNVRPYENIKETYNYETPKEIPDNSGFEWGNVIDDSSEDQKTYKLNSWNLYKDLPSVTPIGNTAFIRREFNDLRDEIERYAVIGVGATNSIYYLESQRIPVHQKDRLGFSVDVKWSGQIETSPGFARRNIAMIRLYADDGTYYSLHGGNSSDSETHWTETNATFTTNREYFYVELDGADDDTEYRTATFWAAANSTDIPKDGFITVCLHAESKTNEFETHFANLQLTYIPFINGSHKKYTGHSHKDERTDTGYFGKREENVFIADSPKKLFKGALQYISQDRDTFSGNAHFVAPNSIILENGDYTRDIRPDGVIRIIDSLFNNKIFKLLSTEYNLIGDQTVLTVTRGVTTEGTVKIELYEQLFALTSRWYTAAPFALGFPTSYDQCKPFGEQQSQAVWNQYRNSTRGFYGTVYGLTHEWPDLIHKFELTDVNPNTNNKYFILMEYEQDWKSCLWRGKFIEAYDSVRRKVYDDPHEFRYTYDS